MGLLTPCFVPGEGFLYTIIVPGGGFLLPSSRVPGVCPGGMVLDEIDTCISLTPINGVETFKINVNHTGSTTTSILAVQPFLMHF